MTLAEQASLSRLLDENLGQLAAHGAWRIAHRYRYSQPCRAQVGDVGGPHPIQLTGVEPPPHQVVRDWRVQVDHRGGRGERAG